MACKSQDHSDRRILFAGIMTVERHHEVIIGLQQYCNELSLVSFNIVCSRINHRLSWSSRPFAGGLSVLLVPKNRIYPLRTRPFGVELCGKKLLNCIQKELLESVQFK